MTENIVSIIIPCFNELKFTKMCINSILKYTSYPFELIVIDNGSSDGTGKYFKTLKNRLAVGARSSIRAFKPIISKRNLGVSGALNRGIYISEGKYVCYLNNDVIVTINWLEGLVSCAESDKKTGIVGCASNNVINDYGLFPAIAGFRNIKEIQKAAVMLSLSRKGQYDEALYIHGMCMLIKRSVVDKIGLFDERFYPCSGEDLEYSFRAKKAGYKLVNAMNVFIFHFISKATKSGIFKHKYGRIDAVCRAAKKKFLKKWGKAGRRFYSIYEKQQTEGRASVVEAHHWRTARNYAS